MVCGFGLQKDTFTQIYNVWAYLTRPHHTSLTFTHTFTHLNMLKSHKVFWSLESSRDYKFSVNILTLQEIKKYALFPTLSSPKHALYRFSGSYVELLKDAIGIMRFPGEHLQNRAYLNTMSLVMSGEHLCTQMLEHTVGLPLEHTVGLPLKKRGTANTKRRHLGQCFISGVSLDSKLTNIGGFGFMNDSRLTIKHHSVHN